MNNIIVFFKQKQMLKQRKIKMSIVRPRKPRSGMKGGACFFGGLLSVLIVWNSISAAAGAAPAGPYAASPTDLNKHPAAAASTAAPVSERSHPPTWLLKWKQGMPVRLLPDTEVLGRQALTDVMKVKPRRGMDQTAWLNKLRAMPDIEYIQPNGRVHILADQEPNDPERTKQNYLQQIRAVQAWSTVREAPSIKIALVDTGVDLNHPDLKANLIKGTNLIHPGQSPEDDNGHGTNVAGVLAAVGNNSTGTTGILWKAQIMPVKALDETGYGDENLLGEAILYAVKNGAKIVVLSVGLYRSSPYMKDIITYAEGKGVLLVAASGNDGLTSGSKVEVKYPAAYPTVLAVAGVKQDGRPEPRSNSGTEIDVAAAWNVYTTALGGGYKAEEGTSMAAPQAAGVAAMIWAMKPDLKPYQVRDLLRQTAKDAGPPGWDPATGYGLIQADKAVNATPKEDAFEPNETAHDAKRFPLQTSISGTLSGGVDQDWYFIDVPYDGTLSIDFQGLISSNEPMPPLRITHQGAGEALESQDVKIANKTVDWTVSKGRNYIKLQLADRTRTTVLPYLATAEFQIKGDPYEINDKAYEAFTLAPKSQSITGTFDHTGDQDWYAVTFPRGGTLELQVDTDSQRIDPGLAYQKAGKDLELIDDKGDGETERSGAITIMPGKYYVRVHNAAADKASPVAALYKLKLDWTAKYDDPNEPNNSAYSASAIIPGTAYPGVIGKSGDADWYRLRLEKASIVTVSLTDIPASRSMIMVLYDKQQKRLLSVNPQTGTASAAADKLLNPGIYYVKITANKPFDTAYYHFKIHVDPLAAGFRDIAGHWAETPITALAKEHIIRGAADYRFNPDKPVTRAEAAAMAVRAFNGKGAAKANYKDVLPGHWAYGAIAKASAPGWVSGFPDGTFRPEQPMTRAEIAVMLGRALKLQAAVADEKPFVDVKPGHWAVSMLSAMRAQGIFGGYPGNRAMPDHTATRAEFSAMVYRAISGKG